MKLKLFVLTIILIMFVGCLPNPKTLETQPTNVKPLIFTQTLTLENEDNTNTPTRREMLENCINIQPTRPQGYELSGVVPIRSLSSEVLGLNMSLLDLETGIIIEIDTSNQSVWSADVSPNRQTLAYTWFNTNTSKWELTLVDALGDYQKVVLSSDDGFGFTEWLNNHQLIVLQASSYIIVDSDDGSNEEISPSDYLGFVVYDQSRFYLSFDPLLIRVIYKTGDIFLLDINTNTIISQINDGYDRIPIVAWQTSGNQVAVVGSIHVEESYGLSDEIFIAKGSEQFRQLTHLFESFGHIMTIDGLSWSPNESEVAFWLHDGQSKQTLIVADALTGDVTNYCILNVTSDLFPINIPAPIWSPNGDQLLIENRYAQDSSNLLVIDLINRIAFPIADNVSPIGWMIKP